MTESMTVDEREEGVQGSATENGISLHCRHLFGGAMAIALPEGFVDVSTLRQLSDTQECWADVATDQSVVVEILAHDDEVRDENSARFYLDDIADCNDAVGESSCASDPYEITSLLSALLQGAPTASAALPPPSVWGIRGMQQVAKFKESERNAVTIHLAVARVPSVDSDIVIHLNQPMCIDQDSSSATVARATPSGSQEEGAQFFCKILSSLEVRDWALFAPPDEHAEGMIFGKGPAAG